MIASLYQKHMSWSPCTSLHKREQEDRTKTFAKFPDHISIDYVGEENGYTIYNRYNNP